jgi:hypothetical protein
VIFSSAPGSGRSTDQQAAFLSLPLRISLAHHDSRAKSKTLQFLRKNWHRQFRRVVKRADNNDCVWFFVFSSDRNAKGKA